MQTRSIADAVLFELRDPLSQDAARAKCLGYSYGQYKGLQHERDLRIYAEDLAVKEQERKRKHLLSLGWGVCPQCGEMFPPVRNKKYCSVSCARKFRGRSE